jgi:signal transduction histidine kinase/AraC-like DNA-binding protein/CheY-like chemotaxis protein
MRPSSDNFESIAELRREALTILLLLVAGCWVLALSFSLIYTEFSRVKLPLEPLICLLIFIILSDQFRRREKIFSAAVCLVLGLVVAPALFLGLQRPVYPVYFFFVLPVVAGGMVIGGYAEFWITGAVISIITLLTFLWETPYSLKSIVETLGLIWSPSLACFLVAAIVHLNDRNILMMVQWAIDSQQKDAKRAQFFFEQQEKLRIAFQEVERVNSKLQLLNAQLSEARQVAEDANRLKTQFLANVSHELRSPLNVILSYSQTALQDLEDEDSNLAKKLSRGLDHISKSGEDLKRLINDLLDLSRAEINTLEVYPESVELDIFLPEVFSSIAATAPHNCQVKWQLNLPQRLPVIKVDPVRLRQILFNLFNNAMRFTKQGQVSLGAEVAPPHLHLWIEDTGSGIPLELQERVFEPFVTAGPDRTGIGLGLSISRRLVEAHNGLLTLESRPGVGSIFHIYLPLPSVDESNYSLNSLAALKIPSTAQPVLLLLTSQDRLAPEISEMGDRLQLPFYELTPSTDLVELLNTVNPLGLILDLTESGTAEWDILQRLRSHPQLCQVPLILYSQHKTTNAPELNQGVTNVMLKPVSGSTLIQTIQTVQPTGIPGPVLIVDDDPHTAQLYASILQQAYPNFKIITAQDGSEALEQLQTVIPRLVILDLMMPKVSGFIVLDRIRSNPLTRKIPVLVLSGQMLGRDQVERLNYSEVVFQSKEILSETELTTSLGQVLTGGKILPLQTSIMVKRAIAYIHENFVQSFSREDLAGFVGVTERYLSKIFREEMGLSPWDYLTRLRIKRAKELLKTSEESITSIAEKVGFNDSTYFSRVFHKEVGFSPREYRERGS